MKATGHTKETIREIGALKKDLPLVGIGDTVSVQQTIKEADKERIQAYDGDVIAIHNNGVSSTFTVRKLSAHGIYVERIFPFHSPLIKEIKVLQKGDVRRAKLYYVRHRVGRAAQIKKLVKVKNVKSQPSQPE